MTEFTKWLTENDFIAEEGEEESLSKKALAKLKAQFESETKTEPSPHGKDFMATLESEKAERDRVNSIDRIAAQYMRENPVQLEAIEECVKAAHAGKTVTTNEFELGLLRSIRTGTASNVPKADKELGAKVFEAAIAKSIGMQGLEKHYSEQVLDATDKHFRHGIGLQQLLFKAAAANGEHFDSVGNLRPLLEAAFGVGRRNRIQATAFSSLDIANLLSDVLNKRLRDYFMSVDQAWREISAVTPVRDFKQVNSYSLTGDMEYEQIGPTGEIKHGTASQESYTNQADTYAKMLAITRKDIINDDLGALNRVPQRMGRGGALKLNTVFWTEFLNNSSFFAAGNSNVSTGAGSALDLTGAAINAAEVVFINQTDPDGQPVAVMPTVMLVPPTLHNTARALMGGTRVEGGNTTLSVGLYQGRYRVATSPYMENSALTGNSTAAWYLLASPMDMPVIETVFLNGRDMPTVESSDADFNNLGIQVRGYHDFGVNLQEPRGGVRSAGS